MKLTFTRDDMRDERVFTLRFSASELADVRLDETERQMVHWFEQQPDIEAKLMALQIFARKIESSGRNRADATSNPSDTWNKGERAA